MSGEKRISIVMIEDDPDLCQGWQDLFDMLGHEFRYFQRGQAFLQDQEAVERCTLVITDYYLPDMNGVDLIKKIREKRPELSALLLTGSRELFIADSIRALPNSHIMHKPMSINAIEEHISKVFAA